MVLSAIILQLLPIPRLLMLARHPIHTTTAIIIFFTHSLLSGNGFIILDQGIRFLFIIIDLNSSKNIDTIFGIYVVLICNLVLYVIMYLSGNIIFDGLEDDILQNLCIYGCSIILVVLLTLIPGKI